jgi:flagellar FliL protein
LINFPVKWGNPLRAKGVFPMADEREERNPEEAKQKKPTKKSRLLIFIAGALVITLGAGIATYMLLFSGKGKAESSHKEEKANEKIALFSLDPFVLNLAEQGRFLKVTMQFELTNPAHQQMITERVPHMRDAIITLLSSKSSEIISSPEGKFQLKDELLLRANQAAGKDVFKNLYFTEFVMQ